MFVELWSFVFQTGRRLRRRGTAGRRRLNALGVGTGIVLAVVQGAGVAIALSRQGLLVSNSLFGVVVTDIILAAGSAIALLLAEAVSRWGLGNGFCLFLMLRAAEVLVPYYREQVLSGTLRSGIEPLLALASIGVLLKMFVQGPVVVLSDSEKREVSATFSTFPQGLVPLTWTSAVFINLSALPPLLGITWIGLPRTPILELCTAALIVTFSFCTFHLFSSRKRLDSNLPDGALPPGDDLSPVRWLPATALLVVFGTVLNERGSFLGLQLQQIPSFAVLVMLVAYVLDLAVEIRFRLKYGAEIGSAIEMDNVHGVSYLRGVLAMHGIDSVARAFYYRSLFYFLEPIVKMELLVPTAKMVQALEIIDAEKVDVV